MAGKFRATIRAPQGGFKAVLKRMRRRSNAQIPKKELHRRLEIIWRDAALAFVLEVARHVRVDTGMSAASFIPLATKIKRITANSAIQGVLSSASARNRRPIAELPTGKRRPRDRAGGLFAGIGAGKALGKRAYTFSTGNPNRVVLRFSFTATVYQLAYWEKFDESLAEGLKAFRETAERRVQEVGPAVMDVWYLGGTLRDRGFGETPRLPIGLD